MQAGQADAFVHYLHGLVLSDRRGPASRPATARQAQQHMRSCLFLLEVLRVVSGNSTPKAWRTGGVQVCCHRHMSWQTRVFSHK